MKRLCFCLCTALGILLFVLKKPIGITVLGLCAVLFVLSVCVNIFSKKKLSATLVSDGTGLKNKDMSLKFIFTGTCGEYSGKLRLRNMLTGQCNDIKVHFIISREPAQVDITVKSDTCGKIKAEFLTLRAFDFTGLTWKKAQCEIKGSVNIMPDAAEIDESEEAKLKEALESDFFSNENEGFDHSEPIGIRGTAINRCIGSCLSDLVISTSVNMASLLLTAFVSTLKQAEMSPQRIMTALPQRH